MRRLTWILICGFALTTQAAWSAVRKVPQQYPTINDAVTAAVDGDVIKIDKGRYQEVVTTTKRLTFQGKKGTIWGGYYGGSNLHNQLTVTADGVTVKGIEFQNGTTPVTITGDNASVTECKFKGTEDGVLIDGASATVSKNDFMGLQGSTFTINIVGPDAVVDDNEVMDGNIAHITVDAEDLGTATITNNRVDTNGSSSDPIIYVTNATAPTIKKNKILNTEVNNAVIKVDQCDNAVVSGNVLINLNDDAGWGIYVAGASATVTRNKVENIVDYDSDTYGIYVNGSYAKVTKNEVRSCGAGEEYDTYGIYVRGTNALIESNLVEDLGGSGDDTYGIRLELGNDSTVSKNTVRNLYDEYVYGIELTGDRIKARKNKLFNLQHNPLLAVYGNDFTVEKNIAKGGASSATGITTSGSATTPGAAVLRGNKVSNVGGSGILHSGSSVLIQNNTVNHCSNMGLSVNGSSNTLKDNEVKNTGDDAFYINGTSNSLSKCKARNAARDGYDINGSSNTMDKCKAFDCAAEGLDNGGGTNTTATHCTLKRSRIDFAGNGGVIDFTGTTYQTGGAGTAPEID